MSAPASRKTRGEFAEIEKVIRQIIPPEELETLVDNIGFPISGINMTYNNTGTIGSQDGDIQIRLSHEHRPTEDYVRTLREELPARFPGATFSFLPADIISQILNFGSPAPIDVQIRGPNLDANFAYAQKVLRELRHVPGLVDARIQQSLDAPAFEVDVDRTRAQYVGITERDVTNSMVVNLAGQQPGAADVLAQSRQRRLLLDRDADAAISGRFAQRAAESSHHRAGNAAADAGRHRRHQAGGETRGRRAIQHPVDDPDLRAPRQGRDLGAVAADVQKILNDTGEGCAEGRAGRHARAGQDHEQFVLRAHLRPARRRSC